MECACPKENQTPTEDISRKDKGALLIEGGQASLGSVWRKSEGGSIPRLRVESSRMRDPAMASGGTTAWNMGSRARGTELFGICIITWLQVTHVEFGSWSRPGF